MSAGQESPNWPKAHTRTLLAFLLLFVLLLFAFRAVLFPFLMAMYIAYLVEPVIGWATRGKTFGLKWKRAPTLIVLYLLVIGAGVLVAYLGAQTLNENVQTAAANFKAELEKSTPAARLTLSGPSSSGIWIEAGTKLVAAADRTEWRT